MLLLQELNELKKLLLTGHTTSEENDDAPCTLEEIERTQKDLLERGLQVVKVERKTQKANYLIIILIPPLFTPMVLKGKLMSVSLHSPGVLANRWRTCASIC